MFRYCRSGGRCCLSKEAAGPSLGASETLDAVLYSSLCLPGKHGYNLSFVVLDILLLLAVNGIQSTCSLSSYLICISKLSCEICVSVGSTS